MTSDEKSSHQKELSEGQPQEEETLLTIPEVLGWQTPENSIEIGAERELEEEKKKSPYEQWKADPSAANLHACTKSLQSTIDSVVASMGATGNPQVMAKARVMAAKAIKTYDPNQGASLPTWVSSQLRALSRENRKSDNILSIPEKVQLDAYAIKRAELDLTDELGREPSLQELADRSHLSIRRIRDVNKKMHPVAHEGSYQDGGDSFLQGNATDFSQDALDYVYNDSDLMDQIILESTTGYNGKPPMDNATLMKKLQLTPVQLTRRKQRLALRIKEILENLEEIQT